MNIESLVKVKPNRKIPELAPGDTVKVSAKIVESGRERIQVFQGVVIRLRRGGNGASFTVRHVFQSIGVERTFPLYSPLVEKVEIVRHGKVRRAKLYYLRERSGKSARIKERRVDKKKAQVEEQPEAQIEEQPEAQIEEQPEAQIEEQPEAQVEEQPEAQIEEQPEAQVEEQPETQAEEQPEAQVEEQPKAQVEEQDQKQD
ncbi:hypothetical protein ES703_65040 [subsurface metagenome]